MTALTGHAVGAGDVAYRVHGVKSAVQLLLRANGVARREAERGKCDKERIPRRRAKAVRRHACRHRSHQNAEKRHALHAAHAGGDAPFAADVAHERVFRRRVERTLEPHQQHRADYEPRRVEREARDGDGHDRELRPLRIPHDAALRPERGQSVRERRAKDVGQHQRPGRDAHRDRLDALVGKPAYDGEARERLQEVVVKRPEEVGDVKR